MFTFLALLLLFILLGVSLGILTGLIPGLHVNTVAILLLTATPALLALLTPLSSLGVDPLLIPVLVAATVVAVSITHTFLDFIPSTYLGAPEEETALSVLPAHSLLLEGKGYRAVYLSALGSMGAIFFSVALLLPYRFLFGSPGNLYYVLKENLGMVVLSVAILLIITERSRVPYPLPWDREVKERTFSRTLGVLTALSLFLLSGAFGYAIFRLPSSSPLSLPSSVLFPALSGLFGVSTLLESIRSNPTIPPQSENPGEVQWGRTAVSQFSGGLAGSIVGFLPGMSSGVATVLAMLFRKDSDREQTIVTLSAINTANSMFVLAALFLLLRPRSGAAIVVNNLVTVEHWDGVLPPGTMSYLMISAVISSSLAYFLTLFIGKRAARYVSRVDYGKLVLSIIVFIVIMVILFNGATGLLILAVGTAIGLLPIRLGVRRSHLMGVIMLPVLLYIW